MSSPRLPSRSSPPRRDQAAHHRRRRRARGTRGRRGGCGLGPVWRKGGREGGREGGGEGRALILASMTRLAVATINPTRHAPKTHTYSPSNLLPSLLLLITLTYPIQIIRRARRTRKEVESRRCTIAVVARIIPKKRRRCRCCCWH